MATFNYFPTVGGGTPAGPLDARIAFALAKNSALTNYAYSNLIDGAFLRGGGVGAPALAAGFTGGVLKNGATTGYLGFNTPAGTVDSALVAAPTAESWMVGARVRFPATVFTAAKFVIPCGLVGIYIQGDPATSTTHFQINLVNAGNHFFDTGAAGILGSTNCPVGAFIWVMLEFNVTTGVLTPYFNDVAGTPRSGADLASMPTTAAAPIACYSNDATMGQLCSHIFMATVLPA